MQNSNQRSIRLVQISLCLLCQLAFLAAATLQAYATNGLPQSPKFGFGARVDPWAIQVDYALTAAADNGLDWISVDFNWSLHWPEPNRTLDLTKIDHIMNLAADNDLSVLLSITNPPSWALTPAGPEPDLTAGLVAQFKRLYPKQLRAIELFPAANTKSGWGALPNPAGYVRLLEAVSLVLTEANSSSETGSITLIAAGLVSIDGQGVTTDMDDLEFLQQLYNEGAARLMPVVGLRFPALNGEPIADPRKGDAHVLRRYELIRNIMLENGHSKGLIWITGFSWPALEPSRNGKIFPDTEDQKAIESAQSDWLNHAHQMMKSQLYLGAAFYDCLNPASSGITDGSNWNCMIHVEHGKAYVHPALSSLGYINNLQKDQQSQILSSGEVNSSVRVDINALWKSVLP
jgi:hypothetical protein